MPVNETVEINGHLIDSGILSLVLSDIREYGGDYAIDRFDVGHESGDPSYAAITVMAVPVTEYQSEYTSWLQR